MLILSLFIASTATVLVFFFKDRYVGVATVVGGLIMLHTGVALVLQATGMFARPVVVGTHLLILAGFWYIMFRYRQYLHVPRRCVWHYVAIVVLALGIVSYQFYAVHFSYTGIANTILGESYVAESAYPYPLFSDEWIAVAVATAAIDAQSLPFIHPFTGGAYQNFLFTFHSLIAGVGVLFGGSLATFYVWLGIVVSVVTSALCFVFWRSVGVSIGVATLGMLIIPYVVGGSNLPMLWYLLPWNMGFVLMLTSFIFFARKHFLYGLIALGCSVVMYPPFIVLALFILAGVLFLCTPVVRKRAWIGLLLFTVGAPALFIISVALFTDVSLAAATGRFFSVLIRPIHSAFGSVPTFLPWHVLPFYMLPFAVYGVWITRRELRYVVFPVLLGVAMWLFNPLTNTTFFIDYHRVVAVTALLLLILAIVGLQAMWTQLGKRYLFLTHHAVTPVLMAVILISFLLLAPSYTARDGWRAFTTTYYDAVQGFKTERAPAPVNRYVQPDDLEIFSMISNERFLAPGWKGLVLGTLTTNDPVFTKPSTITMKTVGYAAFLQASCEEKMAMLRKAKVGYVYAEKVNCPGFESIAESREGLHLLRVALQ